jgi:hypothetical protein
MYLRQDDHMNFCILRVSTDVLDLKDVVISDMNAAKDLAAFSASPKGLAKIDKNLVFAQRWNNHATFEENEKHKGIMCAEVLVPNKIEPSYLRGIYASCLAVKEKIENLGLEFSIAVNSYLFFR